MISRIIKNIAANVWLSLLAGTVIFLLISLPSYWLVNYIFISHQIVRYTLYEGYADMLFYLYLWVICFWYLTKKQFRLLPCTLLFTGIAFLASFILTIFYHYWWFYVQTNQNGKYTFDIFSQNVSSFFNDYATLFPDRIAYFLDSDFWSILSILLVGVAAKMIIKNKNKRYATLWITCIGIGLIIPLCIILRRVT